MDMNGRIVHIDYDYILSNSPGGVDFESAPCKLTKEYLDIMEYDAFKSSVKYGPSGPAPSSSLRSS